MTENKGVDPEKFEPDYQSGTSSVEPRDLGAAGDAHPLGSEPQQFEVENMQVLIREFADGQYDSWRATIREYLANSETACLRVQELLEAGENIIADDGYEPKIEVTWDREEQKVVIKDNGIGMAAKEVMQIFRMIGNSANRDKGQYSGQFGMGVLSFIKLIGADNSMIMKTHSRWTDENFAATVSMSGPEPIMGGLAEDEYGTEFEMAPQTDRDGSTSYDIRNAVEQYAEYARIPVLYVEYDESGQEVFNEDYGDKQFEDEYRDAAIVPMDQDYLRAVASPDATGKTLLLSMPIERNDPSENGNRESPFPFDVRLLDESGRVIESSNGNEGLMPCMRSEYEDMLMQARPDAIPVSKLDSHDGIEADGGPKTIDQIDDPIGRTVVVGPKKGREIVPEEEWESMEKGRAELYVPEDELEPYDLDSGKGDLTLPTPTTDRDRLQSHETFWTWIATQFSDQVNAKSKALLAETEGMSEDDAVDHILSLDPTDFSIALAAVESGHTEGDTIGEKVIEMVNGQVMVMTDIDPRQVVERPITEIVGREVVDGTSVNREMWEKCQDEGVLIAIAWKNMNGHNPAEIMGWTRIEERFSLSPQNHFDRLSRPSPDDSDDSDDEEEVEEQGGLARRVLGVFQ